MPIPPDFSKEIKDFYRFFSPTEAFGKEKINTALGGKKGASKKEFSASVVDQIMDVVVENNTPGDIIAKIKQSHNPNAGQYYDMLSEAIKGNLNGLYIRGGASGATAEYMYSPYFSIIQVPPPPPPPPKPPRRGAPPPAATPPAATPPPAGDSEQNPKVVQYWTDVCERSAQTAPSIDFSAFFLRAPKLSKSFKHTSPIELYLTAMPPTFANQLMPYCSVEFQLPALDADFSESGEFTAHVNRPSLYRFLMGSGAEISSLTEADKSIANIVEPSRRAQIATARAVASARDSGRRESRADVVQGIPQTFFGMEMFTTPQTLINMDSLKKGAGRLNDVMPFLPPMTIQGVDIEIQSAGAGMYARKTASLKLHIHDRRRLAEFSDFIRSNNGYSEVTIWITYGMLSPRHRGDNDMYAKFVNETMLCRDAYGIMNTEFSFTPTGGCDVSLRLYTKASQAIESAQITVGPLEAKQKQIVRHLSRLSALAENFGDERGEKSGFSKKEIRVSQVISQAAGGDIPKFDDSEEGQKAKASLKTDIAEVKSLLDSPLPRGKTFNKEAAKRSLDELLDLIDLRSNIVDESKKYINSLSASRTKDPFLPRSEKNDVNGYHMKAAAGKRALKTHIKQVATNENLGDKLNYFDEDLCSTVHEEDHISFGKLFGLLCVPSLIQSVQTEFGAEAASNDIEVQIIFYRLNNKCGPVSGHNIAEFPIHKKLFAEGFTQLQESLIGGDGACIGNMFMLFNEQFQDPRQPGYGRSTFYKSFPDTPPVDSKAKKGKEKPKKKENSTAPILIGEAEEVTTGKNKKPADDGSKKFAEQLKDWSNKYGDEFVIPVLNFEVETGFENPTGTKDLLYDLAGKAAGGYTTPSLQKGNKTIVKMHIYDSSNDELEQAMKAIRVTDSGEFIYVDENSANDSEFLETLNKRSAESGQIQRIGNEIYMDGQSVGTSIGTGKEALLNFLGSHVPYLRIGTEGSLISAASLQSNTNGLMGTIAMQGGVANLNTSLAQTGLSQSEFNQPIRLFPVKMSMTTAGCPLASRGQQFYVDFDTNTTVDNSYIVTSVKHSIGQSKFTTSWELMYSDGYGRMIGGNKITDVISSLKKKLNDAKDGTSDQPATPPQSTKK